MTKSPQQGCKLHGNAFSSMATRSSCYENIVEITLVSWNLNFTEDSNFPYSFLCPHNKTPSGG